MSRRYRRHSDPRYQTAIPPYIGGGIVTVTVTLAESLAHALLFSINLKKKPTMMYKQKLIFLTAMDLQKTLIESKTIVPGRHNGDEWMDWCISKATRMYDKIIKD